MKPVEEEEEDEEEEDKWYVLDQVPTTSHLVTKQVLCSLSPACLLLI
jgi:hypothetical protein